MKEDNYEINLPMIIPIQCFGNFCLFILENNESLITSKWNIFNASKNKITDINIFLDLVNNKNVIQLSLKRKHLKKLFQKEVNNQRTLPMKIIFLMKIQFN